MAETTTKLPPFEPVTVPLDSEGYCESFTADQPSEIESFFWKYGFVVVRDVLSAQEVEESRRDIFAVARVDPDKPESWIKVNWDKVYASSYNAKKGFLGFDTAVTPSAWNNRQNPNIIKAFSAIFKQQDLWVKLDRFGFMRPTRQLISGNTLVDKVDWETSHNWVHWDQNPWIEPDFCRIQAIIAVTDHTNTSGGFHCVPGFTHYFKTWAQENEDRKNYDCLVNFPESDIKENHTTRIFMRKGSILLWDSRTPHGNYPNQSNGFRIVQYTGMFPVPYWEPNAHQLISTRKNNISHLLKLTHKPVQFTPLGKKAMGLEAYANEEKTKATIIAKESTFNGDQCGY